MAVLDRSILEREDAEWANGDGPDYDNQYGGILRTKHASADVRICSPWKGEPRRFSIWSVRVDARYRGQGYGKQLMQAIVREADRLGCESTLCVEKGNVAAIRLYESVGFVAEADADDPRYGTFTMTRPLPD